eukprot:TRINITY_DN13936_c0_g1_i1.p1 TRINITY_DN13936_c0_g1~~TRINITY_DN13936_c0_g1_i1.p1  ORF type:complete len:351 (-),score=37.13 TRINITY_DN13936_c0_g1_i1:837-1751(-)
MATARFWGLETLDSYRICAAILLLTGGVIQGVSQEHENTSVSSAVEVSQFWKGLVLELITLILGAQRWALVQYLTQMPNSALAQMQKIDMLVWIMPCTALVCLILASCFEPGALDADLIFDLGLPQSVVAMSVGIGALTIAELRLVQLTSAVAMNVLSTIHQIPLVLAGVLIFKDQVSLYSYIGFMLCIFGAISYARAKHAETDKTPKSTSSLESYPDAHRKQREQKELPWHHDHLQQHRYQQQRQQQQQHQHYQHEQQSLHNTQDLHRNNQLGHQLHAELQPTFLGKVMKSNSDANSCSTVTV